MATDEDFANAVDQEFDWGDDEEAEAAPAAAAPPPDQDLVAVLDEALECVPRAFALASTPYYHT